MRLSHCSGQSSTSNLRELEIRYFRTARASDKSMVMMIRRDQDQSWESRVITMVESNPTFIRNPGVFGDK